MKTVTMGGKVASVLGQGTWYVGDVAAKRSAEAATLRRGIELGMTVVDTAEMYGSGRAESAVGEAIRGLRERVYLVSKVLPSNASRQGTVRACEASLKRLGTDVLDLYLLHWQGRYELSETVAAFEQLQKQGKIRAWGVSNFDVEDMEELFRVPGGDKCAANQVLYNPEHRGIEWDLLPWCRERGVRVMAYSPLGQAGALLRSWTLGAVAQKHSATAVQVALAWALRQGVVTIPKASRVEHVEENARGAELELDAEDLAAIEREYPAPVTKRPLDVL